MRPARAEHEHLRVERLVRLLRPSATQRRTGRSPKGFEVALARRGLHVLAAHVNGSPPPLEHPTKPLADRRFSGESSQAAARCVALQLPPAAGARKTVGIDHM